MPSDPGKPVELTRALTEAEREQTRCRVALLADALEARDERAIERAVAGMLLSFPSGRASGDEARVVVAAYTNALADLPPWAVNEAARRWTRGEVHGANKTFPPSSAELHEVARVVVDGFKYEAAMLERMLSGVVADPVPVMSRDRKLEIEDQVQSAFANASLLERARALGRDPKQAMNEIPDCEPNDGKFQPIGDVRIAANAGK